MNTQQLIKKAESARREADSKRVADALAGLRALMPDLQGALGPRERGQLSAALESVEADYGRLRSFALRGVDDPQREALYDGLSRTLSSMADLLIHLLRLSDAPTLRYSFLRTAALHPGQGLSQEAARAVRLGEELSQLLLAGASAADELAARQSLEKAWSQVFRRLWTLYPMNGADTDTVRSLLTSPATPAWARQMTVGALTLALLDIFDPSKLSLLAETYIAAPDNATAVRALTGVALALWRHDGRLLPPAVTARLESMAEQASWQADATALALELTRTRSTEKIAAHLRDNVLPGLLKLRPDLERMAQELGKEAADNPDADPEEALERLGDMEANPEWADMLRRSGLEESMRKLSEIEEDGGDVMMAMVGAMKQFPLFNDVSAWFMPFFADHTAVRSTELSPESAAMLEGAPSLCDSDKYSLVSALGMMPAAQRAACLKGIEMQTAQYLEAAAASPLSSTAAFERGALTRNYVQSLYRFFKKFRRKGEFADPFGATPDDTIDPSALPYFGEAVAAADDTLQLMAELCLRAGADRTAARLYDRLIGQRGVSVEWLQKKGYVLKRAGESSLALEAWRQAETLEPDSVWTLRRLVAAAREEGRTADALSLQRRVAALKPDSAAEALALGQCLLDAGLPREAVKELFKAEYLAGAKADGRLHGRALTALAEALLRDGDHSRARTHIERALADSTASVTDANLLLGLLELAEGHADKAVDALVTAYAALQFDRDALASLFFRTLALLPDGTADPLLARIVLDETVARAADLGSRISQ